MMCRESFFNDVAIIGMAGRFPDAECLDTFWSNLLCGRDSIKDFPAGRIKEFEEITGKPFEYKFQRGAYIDSVTLFEPGIFSISEDESRYIDPQERILLEVVEEAILDAGYNPESLSGTNVAVFLGDTVNQYTLRFHSNSPSAFVNSVYASCAGRVSYTYDFRGPSLAVRSACSSSLVAVHEACKCLKSGESPVALVGNVSLMLMPSSINEPKGIEASVRSEEQKTRAFDAGADGFSAGEGGGVVILKLLHKALEDGDNIRGIIKGSSVNSNGRRSNGLSAPSEGAQTEAILQAIENSGIPPRSLSYIESHGTGTKLGDPIEIAGISSALNSAGYRKQVVGIGSLKTNIGHLGNASGIAALVKTVLMLENRMLPPSINFEVPNPLIDFEDSPVYVNDELNKWESDAPMRAGVTSLSLIGTNCHVVLEESLHPEPPVCSEGMEIVLLSARTENSLSKMVERLYEFLSKNRNLSINNIAYTLNCGRRRLKYQFASITESVDDLLESLKAFNERKPEGYRVFELGGRDISPIFLYPDICEADFSGMEELIKEQCDLEQYREQLSEEAMEDNSQGKTKGTYIKNLFLYSKVMEEYSLYPKAVAGFGSGSAVCDLVKGEISFTECMEKIHGPCEKKAFDEARLTGFINSIAGKGHNTFILFNFSGGFIKLCKRIFAEKPTLTPVFLSGCGDEFYFGILKLISRGLIVDWEKVYRRRKSRRVSLPGYSFDRKNYYLKMEGGFEPAASQKHQEAGDESLPGENSLMSMLEEVCHGGKVEPDEYIYNLDINSLGIMQFISKIKKAYNTDVSIKLFYKGKKIREIMDEIINVIVSRRDHKKNLIATQPKKEYYTVSAAQKRMFLMERIYSGSTGYNIPNAIIIEGPLDMGRMKNAFNELVKRHEVLRTSFMLIDSELFQKVHENLTFELEVMESAGDCVEDIISGFVRPFNLEKAPVFRAAIASLKADRHLLLLDIHHIIADGTSLGLLARDIVGLYHKEQLPEVRVQYKDFTAWQESMLRSHTMKKQEEYWLKLFADGIPLLDLPTDYKRPSVRVFEGQSIKFEFDRTLEESVYSVGAQADASLYMVLLSIFSILISRYSGQDDIIIGTPVAGRQHPDTAQTLGMFVNILPIRSFPKAEMTYYDFLKSIKESCLKAFDSQDFQFDQLVLQLGIPRDTVRNPVFDVTFSMLNMEQANIEAKGLKFNIYSSGKDIIQYDIMLYAVETPGVQFKLVYRKDLYKAESMKTLTDCFLNIARAVADNPRIKLSDIPVFPRDRAGEYSGYEAEDLLDGMDIDFDL